MQRHHLWVCIALAAITFAAYWPVHRFGFVSYDDFQYVYANPHVLKGLSWSTVKWAFTTFDAGCYIPVTWLSLLADTTLFNAQPGAQHIENVVLHTANSILLFYLLLRTTAHFWPSTIVAAIFAVHPTHVESVAWITERKDVLYMLFFLLAMHSYAGFAAQRSFHKTGYVKTFVFATCGLLSKSMLVTFPLVLLLFDFWPLGRLGSGLPESAAAPEIPRITLLRAITEKIPFLLLSIMATVLGYKAQAAITASLTTIPFSLRAQNAILNYVGYLAESFWPVNLCVLYPYRWSIPASSVFWYTLILAALTVYVLLPSRTRRMAIVCWLWFLGTLIPAIGIVQVGLQSMADRFLYLPSIGLSILVVWKLRPAAVRAGGVATGIAVVVLIVALMVLTRRQVGYWQDSDHLVAHASVVLNGYAGEEIRLGVLDMEHGKPAAAEQHFQKALQEDPGNYAANFDLGNLLLKNDPSQAIDCYKAAAMTQPTMPEVQINWGVALLKLNDRAQAFEHFRMAESLDANSYDAHYNLGRLLLIAGKLPEARAEFMLALQSRPNDAPAERGLRETRH